jgi:hypothetical protein
VWGAAYAFWIPGFEAYTAMRREIGQTDLRTSSPLMKQDMTFAFGLHADFDADPWLIIFHCERRRLGDKCRRPFFDLIQLDALAVAGERARCKIAIIYKPRQKREDAGLSPIQLGIDVIILPIEPAAEDGHGAGALCLSLWTRDNFTGLARPKRTEVGVPALTSLGSRD